MTPEALARLRTEAENRFHSVEIQAEDLRALLDAYDTARAEAVSAERARVVADLHTLLFRQELVRVRDLADRYERGDHDKEGER